MKRLTGILVFGIALAFLSGSGKALAFGDKMKGMGGQGVKAGAPADTTLVEKAPGPNSYTVAEIYAKGADLEGKNVVVRARVAKVSGGIMGKNWIHLWDGSGNKEKGNHDLVATSKDLPSVGDVVTASGTMRKDKDFGAGYRYEAILEETTFSAR